MNARSIFSNFLTPAALIAALVVIGFQYQATEQPVAHSHEGAAHATDADHMTTHIVYGPQSLEELKGWAQEIVVARISSIKETKTNGSAGQYVTMEVQQRLKGTIENSFKLYYPGMELGHGPAYTPGQRYLLFLDRDHHDDFYMAVTPEGRYRIERDGKVAAISEQPYAKALEGKDIADVVRMIEGRGQKP